MQIVTDRAADLAPEQLEGLEITFSPLYMTLDGRTYSSGVNIEPAQFYDLLNQTDGYPTTSMPSAGDFAKIYRELAKKDPEILSIHVSSGLSGTIEAARAGAALVPEAKITLYDSRTLSVPMGWQVYAAAKAIKAGWPLEKIITFLDKISVQANGLFTLPILKYLIHGGRISHMRGLIASALNIKPVIGVSKDTAKYVMLGQDITFKRALQRIVDVAAGLYSGGGKLLVQLLHASNPEGVEILRQKMADRFDIHWLPVTVIAPVLGAHTGPGLVGMSVGPANIFEGLP